MNTGAARQASRRFGALLMLFALLSTGVAVAASPSKGKRVQRDKACTMVTERQVEKAFGSPVAEGVEQTVVLSCTYLVGVDPNQPPGGSFATQQLFPSILNTTDTAKQAVADSHAIDLIAEDDLREVEGVGRRAYFNATHGRIVVQATKKFAFVLIWSPESVDGRITKKQEKQLIKLAKDVVKRAPR